MRIAHFLVLALGTTGGGLAATSPAEWNFTVTLDGKPIGRHRFTLVRAADEALVVDSAAAFDVSWLGVPLYRYRHDARERWTHGCLTAIEARTDDNGRRTRVRGSASGGRLELRVREDASPAPALAALPGCVMTFAYWNPALQGETRLLDPGSGRFVPVVMASIAAPPADLAAQAGPVRGLRIAGPGEPIDVWYASGRWIGLDTRVASGRRLSYRLR